MEFTYNIRTSGAIEMNKIPILGTTLVILLLPFVGYSIGSHIEDKLYSKIPNITVSLISVTVDCEGDKVMIFSDVDTGEVLSRCIQDLTLTPDEYRTDEWRKLKEMCENGQC